MYPLYTELLMLLFLSWSGDFSHKIACVLRDWLPSVIQAIHPYVSSEDIDKGTRWSTDIAKELEQSSYGIICVTKDNIDAPWINFEAGALSKTIDKSNVAPLLLNIKRAEVQGPLLQFQLTVYEKEDMAKLLASINRRLDEKEHLDEPVLKRAFDVWWPHLQGEIEKVTAQFETQNARKEEPKPREARLDLAMLEEILVLSRNQQKLLRSPSELLPPSYIAEVLTMYDHRRKGSRPPEVVLDNVHQRIMELERLMAMNPSENKMTGEMRTLVEKLHHALHEGLEHDPQSHSRRRYLERPTDAKS